MTKYVKIPTVVEAVQWFKMGDHPEVFRLKPEHSRTGEEGNHYISTKGGYYMYVCKSDWVITEKKGVYAVYEDKIFRDVYIKFAETTKTTR